jgi:hypothetical protein
MLSKSDHMIHREDVGVPPSAEERKAVIDVIDMCGGEPRRAVLALIRILRLVLDAGEADAAERRGPSRAADLRHKWQDFH